MRVQWREWRGQLKAPAPGEIRWEDGHDAASAAAKVNQLLAQEWTPCWIHVERTDVPFKGSSVEKSKTNKEKK